MPYDALGNYVPGDDEPSLDQMRLALTQKQPTHTQIPGYDRPVPQADRPLDRATRDLKSIATNMNPLMLMKSMQEMAGTLAVNPLLMPANAAYELATGKPGTFYSQAQTPAGQAFEEDLGKLMDVAKVPHMWPLTPRPAGTRPAITPNDVRVMGAEATRVGRQIRDIPTDFVNAQSGVTRLDPVTNAPTLGAKLQGVAESIGDVMAQREMQGLTPIPGVPAALQPETRMYAVRPKGTSLVTPTRMPTATTMSHPYDPVQKLMYDVLAEPQTTTLTPTQLQTAYERVVDPTMQPDVENARNAYIQQRIQSMFPDAPSADAAGEAFIARFADPDTRQAERLKFIQDFITQTPEGQQSGLPLPSEIQARHEAAVTWLNGPFANYVKRNVGTEGDPLVKLASQGLTFLPDATIREMAADANYITRLAPQRIEAGFPAEGTFASSIEQVDADLGRVRSEIAELEKRRSVLRDLAQSQGLLDPADMPEYAALTDPIRKKVRERDKLEEERIKLQTGQAYEDLSDLAVVPKQAGDVIQNMDYAQRQFYPTLAMTPPGEKAYLTSNAKMRELGLGDVANAFYDDVLSGAIPLDKVQKTTVENYVRGKAQERVKAEAIAKAKEAEARAQAERNLKAVVQEVPNSMIFGNAAVIELNDRTPIDVATRRVSEDTAILDHCVGEGGTARGDVNNPFTGKRQKYEPIIDLTTGQPNPKASKDSTAYIRALQSGEQLASIRDVSTGRPVATLQFSKSHLGSQGQQLYRIGYASGVHNGAVDPAYAESIRNYLNSRAGEIASTGDNLADNVGVYDTKSPEEIRALSRKLGVSRDAINTVDFESLPRFVVAEDVSKALKQVKATLAEQTTQGARETDLLLPAAHDAINHAFHTARSAVDPINDGTSRVARMFSGLWSDIRDTHLPANATIANLRAIRTRLENTEAHYANRGTGEGDAMAEAISEILLPAINDILEQRTPPAEAAAMLMEPDDAHPAGPMPDILGGPDVMGIINEVVTDTLNNDGLQVGERVETVVHRIAGQINPVSRTQEYIQALRDAADREQSERVELTLYDIADRIETQMIQANAPVVAPQQFTRPDVDDMARDLLEDARIDNQRFNGADLQTTLQALETGNFDDARFRALPAAQQTQAQSAVAARLRELMQEANRLQAIEGIDLFPELQGQPQQANVARYIPIAEHAANMTFDQLRDALTPAEMGEVTAMHDDIVRNNPNPDEIRQIAQMVYNHQMGPWEDQPDTARAMLYMELTYTANRMEQEPPQRRGPQGYQDGGSVKAPGIMGSLRKMVSLDTPQDMTTGETVADIAAGFVPGLGTAQSARDFERARREGDKLGMGLAAVGMLPVVGGMVKPVKATAKRLANAVNAGPEVGGTFYRGIPRVAESDLSTVSGLHAKERKTHGITPGTRANTQNYAWASDNPLVAETYSHRGGVMVPMTLTEKPGAVFDAQGKPWHEWFYPGEMNVPRSEYAEALKDPAVKSILVKNILDPGGGVTDEAFLRRLYEQVNKTPVAPGAKGRQQLQSFDPDKYLLGNNLLVKDPSVMRYRLTGEKTEFAKGGTVGARQAQTSAQTCINKANGGTVSRTPSLDSMRLELMMRRK